MRPLYALALALLLPVVAAAGPLTAVPAGTFTSDAAGAEGITFDRTGRLVIGTAAGEIRRFEADGSYTVLANIGDAPAGMMGLRDGRVLVCAYAAERVWAISPTGAATVLASGIPGANFAVATRTGRIYVSSSSTGKIVEVSGGTPVDVASGLNFPNGLAIGPDRQLYVAELGANQISRLPINKDGTLGAAEVYATGLTLADGIGFDRHGNLVVVGFDTMFVVDRKTRLTSTLSTDASLNWPSNLAFGTGHGFNRRDLFLVNYGLPLGSGTTVVRFSANHGGAKLQR